ncbi:MAG: zinc ribbon domain-containing protein [Desulfosalsimonas sp.]
MPIYEYQCEDCKKVFEVIVMGSDPETPACEKCGSRRVARRITAANTIGGSSGAAGAGCSTNSPSGFS